MVNPTNANAPGLTGATQPFGAVVITAACAPQPIQGHRAFVLPCGGTLTSQSAHPVLVSTQLVDSAHNPQGPDSVGTVAPGQSLTLTTPPTGQQWLVVDMTQRQVAWVTGEAVVIGAAVAGFAVYGVVELVEHLIQRHRRHRALRRLFDGY